jgi:hypothetical protein
MIPRGISRRVNDRGRVLLQFHQGAAPVIGRAPAGRLSSQTGPMDAVADAEARLVRRVFASGRLVKTEGQSSLGPLVPSWQQGLPALAGRIVTQNQVLPNHQATSHLSQHRTNCRMRKPFLILPLA